MTVNAQTAHSVCADLWGKAPILNKMLWFMSGNTRQLNRVALFHEVIKNVHLFTRGQG